MLPNLFGARHETSPEQITKRNSNCATGCGVNWHICSPRSELLTSDLYKSLTNLQSKQKVIEASAHTTTHTTRQLTKCVWVGRKNVSTASNVRGFLTASPLSSISSSASSSISAWFVCDPRFAIPGRLRMDSASEQASVSLQ